MNRTTTQEVNVSTETRSPNAEASDAAQADAAQAAKYAYRIERTAIGGDSWQIYDNRSGEGIGDPMGEIPARNICRRLNEEAAR